MIILCFLISELGVAQTRAGTSALPFLEINNNAKSMGLAGADVARMGGNGAHLNPAILGNKNAIVISSPFNLDADYPIFITPWLPTLTDDITFSSPTVAVGFDAWSMSYHVNRLDYGMNEVFLEDENQKTYNSYDVIRGLSFSYKVNEKFSVGMGVNAYKSKIFNSSFSGFTFDFGTYFEHPIIYQDLKVTPSLGWSLTDFGQAIKIKNETYFIDTDSDDEIQTTIITNSYPINTMMRGGAGLKLESDTKVFGFTPISLAWYGALSKSMVRYKEDGTGYNAFQALVKSWTPMCTERYTMSFGSSECSEEVSVWDQFMRHSGFEFVILETVSLRFGHYYEDEYNGDREYDTFGIGVQYSYFAFDYAEYKAPPTDYLRNGNRIKYYQFSLNIPLSLGSKIIKK